MHEIRATVPPECVAEAVRLAHTAGIERVTIAEVFLDGKDAPWRTVSVDTSTPKARAFVERFLASGAFKGVDYTLTAREVRAILGKETWASVTYPMSEPFPDILQDMWQLSHLTASYLGRAAGGAVLMAMGVMDDDPIAIVVAALFLPFLTQVLAISFGMWIRDRGLLWQGVRAILASTILALSAGATVALIEGGPIRFHGFRNPLSSLAISAVIGTAAGLSSADDAGRRYLIGVAAAVQFAIFPVWLGAALVIGLPDHGVLTQRMVSFVINLAVISGSALAAYAGLHLRASGRWSSPLGSRQG